MVPDFESIATVRLSIDIHGIFMLFRHQNVIVSNNFNFPNTTYLRDRAISPFISFIPRMRKPWP